MITSTRNTATTGKVLALAVLVVALAASLMLVASPAHASTTFTVNSTEDHADAILGIDGCFTGYTVDGAGGQKVLECTLRAALNEANYTPGADTINFAIPGTGVKTIAPEPALPTITGPVTINGYSQPGASPNTLAAGSDAVLKIELSGASASQLGHGLVIEAANSTVKGLVVNRWYGEGILINGSYATGNKVTGNYVGTDASGLGDLGNSSSGVRIFDAPNNTVGGTTAGERNVISANNFHGVEIGGATATGNKVTGNYVGTDASGLGDLGNSANGVSIRDALNNTIGGSQTGERNVISGNGGNGVNIYGSTNSATGNKVIGNYVGTARNGAVLGNSNHGVLIVGARSNTIGGTQTGERNVISANNGDGVQILGNTNASGNRVLSNSIFSNGDLGIDLDGDGVTPNDPADEDIMGANDLQNFPVLTSTRKSATGTTTVKGTLNSTPGKTFQVQFFSNPEGTHEGKTLLGSKSVSTNGTGNVSITFSTTKTIRLGQNITATATNTSTGDTSEFSAPRKVVAQ